MNQGELPRTGTIRLPDPVEPRRPWGLIVIAILVVAGLAFFFLHGNSSKDPYQSAVEMRDSADYAGAISLGEEQLKDVSTKEEAKPWRELLADASMKAKQKEKAREHFKWLAQNYPKEPRYKKALKLLGAAPKAVKPPKK